MNEAGTCKKREAFEGLYYQFDTSATTAARHPWFTPQCKNLEPPWFTLAYSFSLEWRCCQLTGSAYRYLQESKAPLTGNAKVV